jgi:hypothetical protein
MLKIENIDKFTTMLCDGKVAHKVILNGLWYVFHFKVSDFTPKVQKLYRLLGDDVEIWLERTPDESGKYKMFVSVFANEVNTLVEWDELQRPYLLATIMAKLLEKLKRIC